MRRQTAGVVDDPMTGIRTVKLCLTQDAANQSGVPGPPDQPGDLPVGGDAPLRDLRNDGENFIDQGFLGLHRPQGSFPKGKTRPAAAAGGQFFSKSF